MVKPSIVAIASRVFSNPEFPDIIGTGFIAEQDGVILTNDHVIRALKKLPRLKEWGAKEWPARVLYLHHIPEKGVAVVPLPILGVGTLGANPPPGHVHYGTAVPDLGFIHVNARGLPPLKVADHVTVDEGDEIMVAGFPMGTVTLRAPGWIHQLSPTLQSGIVSCVLPFRCDNPHALMLDVLIQGGSSGSPVFDPTSGEVVGVVYAGLIEEHSMRGDGVMLYSSPTSHTFAIPAHHIQNALRAVASYKVSNPSTEAAPTLADIIASAELVTHMPRTPSALVRTLGPDDIE
ncbi:MAG: serine protease [Candidatus Binatus sp.]